MQKGIEQELLGDTIAETCAHAGLTIEDFAELMGISKEDAVKLISAETEIDMQIASKLEKALDIDAQFWLNREKIYRQKLAESNLEYIVKDGKFLWGKEPSFKKKRGFAAMSPEKQREIASLGGKASHGGGRKPKVRGTI